MSSQETHVPVPLERARLERMLRVLAQASLGDYDIRIDDLDRADDDPFLELEVGFNMVLDEIQLARQRNTAQRQEIEQQAERLAAQHLALMRLTAPIITVARGVLALPIIGTIEAERAQSVTDALLSRIAAETCTHVILDLTGAGAIVPATAASLLRMTQAVRLLGATCLMTGISPAAAQTLVALDFNGSQVRIFPQLADALAVALANAPSRR